MHRNNIVTSTGGGLNRVTKRYVLTGPETFFNLPAVCSILIAVFGSAYRYGIFCALIILVIIAVMLHRILGGYNRDSNARNCPTLILITGSFFHVAGNSKLFLSSIGRQPMHLTADCQILATELDRPVNGVVQFCIALDAGNENLVFQCEIALVDKFQILQIVGTARLPKHRLTLMTCSLYKAKRLSLSGNPVAFCILHLKFNIECTGLNGIHPGRRAVGKPSKGRSDQHGHAQKHGHHAHQQCSFRVFAFCHL